MFSSTIKPRCRVITITGEDEEAWTLNEVVANWNVQDLESGIKYCEWAIGNTFFMIFLQFIFLMYESLLHRLKLFQNLTTINFGINEKNIFGTTNRIYFITKQHGSSISNSNEAEDDMKNERYRFQRH